MRPRFILLTVLIVLSLPGSVSTAHADSFLFVSLLQERKIVTFRRIPDSGELQKCGETACPAEPAFSTASADGRTLFVSLRSSGELASFGIDPASGELKPLSVVKGGDDPAFLMTDRTGRFLLTAYYVSDKITVHSISADGGLSEVPVCSVSTADNAHGIAMDSGNRNVYVSHTGANRIFQFAFDEGTGLLTELEPAFVLARSGQHPRHIVLHPSDRWAYCSNEAGDSSEDGISLYQRTISTGNLVLQQSLSSLPADFDAGSNSTSRCLMSPNGRFVYVANRGHNSLAGFAINPSDGRLNRISVTPTEAVPRSFAISRDGRHLYAAGEASGHVAGYRISEQGELAPFCRVESGPISWAVVSVETQHP